MFFFSLISSLSFPKSQSIQFTLNPIHSLLIFHISVYYSTNSEITHCFLLYFITYTWYPFHNFIFTHTIILSFYYYYPCFSLLSISIVFKSYMFLYFHLSITTHIIMKLSLLGHSFILTYDFFPFRCH